MKGFLTGIATGLAIGYLTAPRSGKETRDQLAEAANEKTKGLKDQWEKTSAQVSSLVEDVKAQAGLAKEKASVFADQAAGKANQYGYVTEQKTDEYKDQYNDNVDDAAGAAYQGIDKAQDAFKF